MGIEKRYFMDYRPVSQLVDNSSPLEFSFTGSVDKVDLKNTELHVKAQIVNSTGCNITEDECVAPRNLLLNTLFENVDIAIQGKQMTHVMDSYSYSAYMKTIKCLGTDNNHMESIGRQAGPSNDGRNRSDTKGRPK